MSKPEDTDIHRPGGSIFRGDKFGHADPRSRLCERDGVIFKGEEIGYVDEQRKIRKSDGVIFEGEQYRV